MDFSLPFGNPVIIFALVLFIILFAPILFNKIRIPHIIGLIIAGVIVGPYGLNLLLRDSSIVLFGTVGLIYIMFTAGLEIDMEEFKKNRVASLVFGLYTFIVPMILGTLAAYYLLGFNFPSSLLLSSMFASHTLLAYPIASKFGITRIRSVTLSIGGTIITDILSLLVLAAVVGMYKGEISTAFWVRLGISSIVFATIIFLTFPLLTRWFFKRFDDSISQYIYVLFMVFLGSFLAEAAGLEAIIGAFLAGLALNRFIPHSSPLMNRIDFVGNALFIPFFLIGVGMLVDFSVLFKGFGALKVAGVMIVLAVVTKFIAAWLTQKTFKLSKDERQLIFGLTTARVGATLAVVLVGYNVILGETATGVPIRLLNEDVLNGTILMILVTCTISSFVVEKASRKMAFIEDSKSGGDDTTENEKILISLAYPETVNELVDFGLMLKSKNKKTPVYALHIVAEEETDSLPSEGKKMLQRAVKHAMDTDNTVLPLTRFDYNISNGIVYTIKEHNFTDVIIGLHNKASESNDFFGPIADKILRRVHETVYIYKAAQPFNTLKRIVVVVPFKAELEPGFLHWFHKLYTSSKETGLPLMIYAHPQSINHIEEANRHKTAPLKIVYNEFTDWNDFLIFSRDVKSNDLFIIISSRKGHTSYHSQLDKLPYHLTRYFEKNSFILLYPKQLDHGSREDVQIMDTTFIDTISGNMNVFKKISRLFKRNSNS